MRLTIRRRQVQHVVLWLAVSGEVVNIVETHTNVRGRTVRSHIGPVHDTATVERSNCLVAPDSPLAVGVPTVTIAAWENILYTDLCRITSIRPVWECAYNTTVDKIVVAPVVVACR